MQDFTFDVFISYGRADEDFVLALTQSLRSLGYQVWLDRDQFGDQSPVIGSFADEIDSGIRASRNFLLCWSADAREKEWVRLESMIRRHRENPDGPTRSFELLLDNTPSADLLPAFSQFERQDPEWFDSFVQLVGPPLGQGDASRSPDVPTAIHSQSEADAVSAADSIEMWVLPVGDSNAIVVRTDKVLGFVDQSRLTSGPIDFLTANTDAEFSFAVLSHFDNANVTGLVSLFLGGQRERWKVPSPLFTVDMELVEYDENLVVPQLLDELDKLIAPDAAAANAEKPVFANVVSSGSTSTLQMADRQVVLEFLAPDNVRVDAFIQALESDNKILPIQLLDKIGVAFTVTFGESQLLFTDGIEPEMFEAILRNETLAPQLVVIPKGGSSSHNPRELLQKLAELRPEKTHAVVSASGLGLPAPEVEAFLEREFNLHRTWRTTGSSPGSAYPEETALRSQQRIANSDSVEATALQAQNIGTSCGFRVFSDGTIVAL